MSIYHKVEEVKIEGDYLFLTVDGKFYKFNLKEISPRLFSASKKEREYFEVSASGYGIHWSLIDEDLSIDALIDNKQKISSHRRTLKTSSKKVKNG